MNEPGIGIGAKITTALAELVRCLQERPAFPVAKGGIAPGDPATPRPRRAPRAGAGPNRAGHAALATGTGVMVSRMPSIVFPGHFADLQALAKTDRRICRRREALDQSPTLSHP